MSRQPSPDWTRAAVRRFAGVVVLVVIGALVVVLTDGDAGYITGWTIIGLAGILAVALVFLEIGYSEDRDRRRRDGR